MEPACHFMPVIYTGRPARLAVAPERAKAGADTLREAMYFRKLVQWIREEFEATPDLRLTTREAAAFLGLDLDTCERVLLQLVHIGAITQAPDGRFFAVS